MQATELVTVTIRCRIVAALSVLCNSGKVPSFVGDVVDPAGRESERRPGTSCPSRFCGFGKSFGVEEGNLHRYPGDHSVFGVIVDGCLEVGLLRLGEKDSNQSFEGWSGQVRRRWIAVLCR